MSNPIVPIEFLSEEARLAFEFIPVDNWIVDNPQDIIFKQTKGFFFAPLSAVYGVQNDEYDRFILSSKKAFNNEDFRKHIVRYLNYFEKFYDTEKEYLSVLCIVKYNIDYMPNYNYDAFVYDIRRYVLSPTILAKVERMVRDNYMLHLTYKNDANPALQYTDDHGRVLMQISLLFNIIIPLLTHFAFRNKVSNIDAFLKEVYDNVLNLFDTVDIFAKLFETAHTNVKINEKKNAVIWSKQDIRGNDVVTHSMATVDNIILNIIPKYTFSQNMISFNYASIRKSTAFQITDIEYEFNYIPLSSSDRDEDNNSAFDRFESLLIKQNEALYLASKMNCESTMQRIENMFGPFSEEEINFYINALTKDHRIVINDFQRNMVFKLMLKYFGDTTSIKAINKEDYVKLMIAGKRLLQKSMLVMYPYVLSCKVEKLIGRKTVNKKEMVKLEASPLYQQVWNKYKSEKIMKEIMSTIATIIASDFRVLDFYDQSINGKIVEMVPEIIGEETLMFYLMI